MTDLSNVTFLIPIRIDQSERFRNLLILLRYLKKCLKTNILIGESDTKPYSNGAIKDLSVGYANCSYHFFQDKDPHLNRMKLINKLVSISTTPIIVIQDTDVLLYPIQYQEAVEKILDGCYDLVYPYDGNFYNIPSNLIQHDMCVENIDPKSCLNMRQEGNSIGGILFWNRQKFIECGGCNEKMVSWGFDDNEIYDRALKLGVAIDRCKRGLFHLSHKPSLNSLNGSHKYYKSNEQEWIKVKGMPVEELKSYVKTWGYV